MEQALLDSIVTEHRFWLKLTDDHARFVFYSLSPNESGEIERSRSFIARLGALQNPAVLRQEAAGLNEKAGEVARDFYEFLLQLLALAMSAQLNANLTGSMLNHMLNETAEYLELTERFKRGESLFLPPIHHHLLWLYGSAEHAAIAASGLDWMEKSSARECGRFEEQFSSLYFKSVGLRGWMRTKLDTFPALALLGTQAEQAARPFRTFLENLRDSRKEGTLQGSLLPELFDHMAREESYYLTKIAASPRNAGGSGEESFTPP